MHRNSYISWMSQPLSAAVCPTPHIWPEDGIVAAPARGRNAARRGRGPAGIVHARTDVAGRPMASKEEFMNEEKLRILKMLEDGKVSAAEAARLMEALDRSESRPTESEIKKKWLHIKVAKNGRDTVNMRVPLALLKFGFKLAPHAVRHHGERARHRAEHARAKAERLREKAQRSRERALRNAERTRDRMRGKLSKELGGAPGIDIDDIVNRAFEETLEEAEEAIQEGLEEAEEAVGESLENGLESLGDLDLDVDKIIQMAHSEGFDGKILDVYDDDDDERVIITLE